MKVDVLQARADQLRQSLRWSKVPRNVQAIVNAPPAIQRSLQLGPDDVQELTKEACTVLDSYCAQVNVLDNLLAPVASRTLALSQARQNIKKARERAEEVLDHLDTSRKVRAAAAPLEVLAANTVNTRQQLQAGQPWAICT